MAALVRRWGRRHAEHGSDGFTLVEVLISLAIFGIMSLLVSMLIVTNLPQLRGIQSNQEAQTQQQQAMEWSSRLVRYTGIPINGTMAIEKATSQEFVFYSYAGTGSAGSLPYKVRLLSDETKGLVSEVYAPTASATTVMYTTAPVTRYVLFPDNYDELSPVFKYTDITGKELKFLSDTLGLSVTDMPAIRAVAVRFTDSEDNVQTEQVIDLVNVK